MPNNDMNWLVEASRKAQEKREQFTAPSLTSHAPTGFTGLGGNQPPVRLPAGSNPGLSPQANASAIIGQMREEQAARPVTPTQSGRRLLEELRRQQEAERVAGEQWEHTLGRQELEDERWGMTWERDEDRYQEKLRREDEALARQLEAIRASGSGSGSVMPPEEGAAFDPKRWEDATKIVRDQWNKGEDFVWINQQTGEMVKEDTPGIRPPTIHAMDPSWERQSTARTPFDSLSEYERYTMVAEVYYTSTHLPTSFGFDPSKPPSTMPSYQSPEYYKSLADQAKQQGFNAQDIIQWLTQSHGMPQGMERELGLLPTQNRPYYGTGASSPLPAPVTPATTTKSTAPSITPNLDRIMGR